MSEQVTIATTDQRLAALLDKQDIQEVLLRYTRGMDRHDAALARSAYHEDGRDDHGPYIGSGAGLVEWANGLHSDTMDGHQHYVTNTVIDLDGDTAHAETYYILAAVKKDQSGVLLGGGRYVDRLERRDGRWGIVDRICTAEWFDDPAVLASMTELAAPISADPGDPSYTRPLTVGRDDRIVFGPGSTEAPPL
jgi:hypothetical protein